jgi:SAM-dependent methyltransferase
VNPGRLIYIQTGGAATPPVEAKSDMPIAAEYEAKSGIPTEMGYERARLDWFGDKATKYDEGREDEEKWVKENEAVRKCLEDLVGTTVIDIPCGTGRFFKDFKELKLEAEGFDVSGQMMRQAKPKGSFPVKFGDIMNIPAEDGQYDAALCVRLLEKFKAEEVASALEELARVAKHDIIFSLITGEKEELRNRSWVHDLKLFTEFIESGPFEVKSMHTVREPDYHIWHIRRK